MGCRCNERRKAISKMIEAIQGTEATTIQGAKVFAEQSKFIAKSAAEDVGSSMRKRIVETRQFLQGRLR